MKVNLQENTPNMPLTLLSTAKFSHLFTKIFKIRVFRIKTTKYSNIANWQSRKFKTNKGLFSWLPKARRYAESRYQIWKANMKWQIFINVTTWIHNEYKIVSEYEYGDEGIIFENVWNDWWNVLKRKCTCTSKQATYSISKTKQKVRLENATTNHKYIFIYV